MNQRAVIYCRVSTKDQVDNLSLATQGERCEDFCRRNGWEVDRVFVEEGESAKTADRTELKNLLQHCRTNRGRVHFAVVYAVNRLARNTQDHLVLRGVLSGYGIKLRSVTEPVEEGSAGRFVETLLAAVAQFDNGVRAERTAVGMKAALARGRWTFMAPLGYANSSGPDGPTLIPDPERAPLVRKAFELCASGLYTKAELLTRVRALGLRTRKGTDLSAESLSHLLCNPAYAGVIEIREWGIRATGGFEPLVSEETFRAAQLVLSGRRHRAPVHQRAHPDFPLRHFVRCGACARPLTGSWSRGRGRRYAYYHCPSRGCGTSGTKDALEGDFLALLDRLRPRPEYLRLFKAVVLNTWQAKRQEAAGLETELRRRAEALRQRKERLLEAFVYRGAIDQATYQQQLDKLEADLALVEMERNDAQLDTLDVEGLLKYAEHVMLNAGTLWRDADHAHRLRLQAFFFPSGLTWAAGAFGTATSGSFFNQLLQDPGTKSGVATLEGFEPSIFALKGRCVGPLHYRVRLDRC